MRKPILSIYGTNEMLTTITKNDIKQLDILFLAFAYEEENALTISSLTDIDKVLAIKDINPNIKILISLRNDDAMRFTNAVSTKVGRTKFCKECKDIIVMHNLDGIDLDWEFPKAILTPNEKESYRELSKELHEMLNSIDTARKYYFTVAVATMSWFLEQTRLQDFHEDFDYINLMTYDMNWGSKHTVHHACTYRMDTDVTKEGSVEENLEIFTKAGIPKEKIIIGTAFYGRKWTGVLKDERNGLFVQTEMQSDYAPSYSDLCDNYINKNGYIRYFDNTAKAPYLYNGDTFITYDDEESVKVKCDYIKEHNLAGIMSWHYSLDTHHTLISIMNNEFRN